MRRNRELVRALFDAGFDRQTDFAAVLGVDDSLVSRVIRGRRLLKAEEQERWANLLKLEPEKLQELL